jgi:diguanylate cyclase (GGDEF)-like protein
MYTFPQLLLRNALLGLLFSTFAIVISLFTLAEYFQEQNTQHQKVISSLSERVLIGGDREELAKVLRKSSAYNVLNIKSYTGENIYNYTKTNKSFVIPLITPEIKKVPLKNLDLMITFQLSLVKESHLIMQLLIILAIIITLFVVIASWLTIRKSNTFFKAISQQIKHDLAHINNPEANEQSSNSDLLNIPELREGIEEVKHLLNSKMDSSSKLEKEAYVDSITQLDNRGRFVQFYENNITKESPIKFGVLMISRCSELQTINQIHGYHEGDVYITKVSEIIKKTFVNLSSVKIFRLNSSDFACLLPNVQLKEAEGLAQDLTVNFNEYQLTSEYDSVAYTGLVYFDKSKPLGELLALADTAISVAQTQRMNAWYSQKDTNILKSSSINYGNQNWRQEIESVVENQRISLLLQPIQPNNRNSKVYGEILARFLNAEGEMLPTASFFAMAEKLDKIVAVDRLIIEAVIKEITTKNLNDQSFGINISARTINDEHFLIWLERRLLRESVIASRLVFEISENGLQQNIKISKRFVDMVHRVGSRVTVERFGVGLTSFKFFRDLKPDFIKMDSTYTRDIDEDKNNQYFLRLMVDLAHRLSISVLAESVESQEEKHTLGKLFIDGCQGFYIGKPKPL